MTAILLPRPSVDEGRDSAQQQLEAYRRHHKLMQRRREMGESETASDGEKAISGFPTTNAPATAPSSSPGPEPSSSTQQSEEAAAAEEEPASIDSADEKTPQEEPADDGLDNDDDTSVESSPGFLSGVVAAAGAFASMSRVGELVTGADDDGYVLLPRDDAREDDEAGASDDAMEVADENGISLDDDASITAEILGSAVTAKANEEETSATELNEVSDATIAEEVINVTMPKTSSLSNIFTSASAVAAEQRGGGLRNLGNTCYFNSALQMLRSLDGFTEAVKERNLQLQAEAATQPRTDAEPNNVDDVPSRLAVVFSDVMERLSNDETVEPRDLKQCIDDRSSLFIGYRQQDAHEFLTTLLDLLDEDHKVKKEEDDENKESEHDDTAKAKSEPNEEDTTADLTDESEENAQAIDADSTEYEILPTPDEETPKSSDTEALEVESPQSQSEENSEEAQQLQMDDGETVADDLSDDESDAEDDAHTGLTQRLDVSLHVHPMESALKKARVDQMDDGSVTEATEATEMDSDVADADAPTALLESQTSLSTVKSFRDLEMKDIEDLLHGTAGMSTEESPRSFPSDESDHGERFKLIGGRMSMSDVTLTPLNDSFRLANDVPSPVRTSDHENNMNAANEATAAAADAIDESSVETDIPALKTPVDEHFTTQVRVTLTCDSCKYSRHQTETYSHISVEIGNGGVNEVESSVDEGLRKFFAPESREIKCEKCFCATARQTREIVRAPRALLVHLKRFIVDVSPDYTSISYRKNRIPVVLNTSLPIDESGVLGEVLATDVSIPPNESSTFRIRSIVNHIGSSASCGHYTTDAFCPDSEGERSWVTFNDSYVTSIDESKALGEKAQTTAYMVLYELE